VTGVRNDKVSLKIPSHLKRVGTLPCETSIALVQRVAGGIDRHRRFAIGWHYT